MKKFRLIAVVTAMLMVVALFAACSKPSEPEATSPVQETPSAPAAETDGEKGGAGTYNYQLGIVQPGPEFYYQSFSDSVKVAAEYSGMTATVLLSQYSAETEIANFEDLISRGVDAIACFSVSSDTAQIDAQLCEEANIPLFLMSSTAAEGPAKPVSTIGNSFFGMGSMNGEWVVNNVPGELKVLDIQGQLGQGVAEKISEGFEDAVKARDDIEIVFRQTANWVRSEAITITEDSLMSDLEFNFIFVHNEDMCAGVVNVLEENDMIGTIQVITQNGSDPGIEMIKAGQVLSTCANPPSYVGGDVVVQILKHFDGVDVPEIFDSPTFIIDSSNVDNPPATWDKAWAIARVDEYFASR